MADEDMRLAIFRTIAGRIRFYDSKVVIKMASQIEHYIKTGETDAPK